jgi:hypothetical protein
MDTLVAIRQLLQSTVHWVRPQLLMPAAHRQLLILMVPFKAVVAVARKQEHGLQRMFAAILPQHHALQHGQLI